MTQPNRGSAAPSAPTSTPVDGKGTPKPAPSKGTWTPGHTSGGTKGGK